MSDLNDACKDQFFLPEMRNEFLKGFKVNSFLAAVSDAADQPVAPSSTLSDEFGGFQAPLSNQAATALQQLNFAASNMGSDLPLVPPPNSESGAQQAGQIESQHQLFWNNWS